MTEHHKKEEKNKSKPVTENDEMRQVSEAEYQNLVKEAAEARDRYLRILAEFENARKRHDREKTEFVKYANEGLMTEFLNAFDDLERAVEAATAKHQDYESFLKGIEMVMAHIHDMLKRNQVKPIECVGKKFDPLCHEALMQTETADQEEGTVLEELQKGYWMGDRVIRTAKVRVAVRRQDQPSQDKNQEFIT